MSATDARGGAKPEPTKRPAVQRKAGVDKPKPEPAASAMAVSPKVASGSREARRLTAVILEVLAGQRTPTQAAKALEVSVPRYYSLEAHALEGLVAACEPRRRGPRNTPERENAALRREVERLQRECARSQALLRLSQRTVGVPAARVREKPEPGKRPRKPVIRALKAAQALEELPSSVLSMSSPPVSSPALAKELPAGSADGKNQ